jgi:hypothetical protein
MRLALLIISALAIACGKEGPPLPPLVRLPAPPGDLVAERRGGSVDIRLAVPSANTDGTRPADVERVDVYAITAPAGVTDDQLLELGDQVGSLIVKAPRDPDATVDPDEPVSDVEPPEGPGVDQGSTASLAEPLTAAAFGPAKTVDRSPRAIPVVPLAGPPLVPASRLYAGVGVSTSGRRGPFSARVGVPLAPAPPPVPAPRVTYDESTITVAWDGPPVRPPVQEPASDEVLSATIVGLTFPTTVYTVFDVQTPAERKLTIPPIAETRYEDKRLEWGTPRCYRVHVVHTYGTMTLASDGSSVVCVTPTDTFAPKAPTNLQVVPSEGVISLIWQRGEETDLAGYLVLRATPPSEALTPVTPAPIQETSFTDKVAAGVRYIYAIQAMDKAGNVSAPSAPSELTEAR